MEITLKKIKPLIKSDICYKYNFFNNEFKISFDKCYLDKNKKIKTFAFNPSPYSYIEHNYTIFTSNILYKVIHEIIEKNFIDYDEIIFFTDDNFKNYKIIEKNKLE